MGETRRWLAIGFGLLLAGCGLINDQLSPGRTTIRGVVPDIERLADPAAGARAETQLIRALRERAGLYYGEDEKALGGFTPADWRLILLAGVRMIDGQCDQYLDALFRFNREQRAVQQGLAATAATTGVVLGLASAGATALALTAAAFGLSSSLFDAGTGSVLFTIEPSALRNVVLEGRTRYLKGIRAEDFASRPQTMIALQGYLTQCSPAAIEANINNAANGSRNAVTSLDSVEAERAAMLAAPGTQLNFAAQPVRIELPAPPPPPPAVPEHRTSAELNIPVSKITEIQAILGVKPDGDIGVAGSRTRRAIMEFENGMLERRDQGSIELGPWQVTGTLTGSTRDVLTTIVDKQPSEFQSPFERAFLGNAHSTATARKFTTADPARLGVLWRQLAPGEPDPAAGEMLSKIRSKIADQRKTIDPSDTRTDLDATVWNAVKPKPRGS